MIDLMDTFHFLKGEFTKLILFLKKKKKKILPQLSKGIMGIESNSIHNNSAIKNSHLLNTNFG